MTAGTRSQGPAAVAAGVEASETAGRFAGQSVKRLEDRRLLTGSGQYVDDVVLPGMLHAAFLRSDLARARILRLDTSAAAGLDGVLAVLTAEDLNHHVDSLRCSVNPLEAAIVPGHVLAPGDVRFVGDPVALVVAEDRYLAEDALELIDIEYEPLPPVVDYEQGAGSPHLVHRELSTNLGASDSGPGPRLAEVFESAHLVVTETFHQQRQCNMPIETRGAGRPLAATRRAPRPVGVHPEPPRVGVHRGPRPRDRGASGASPHGRCGRGVRPEGLLGTGRDGRAARGPRPGPSPQVDRGSPREPDGLQLGPGGPSHGDYGSGRRRKDRRRGDRPSERQRLLPAGRGAGQERAAGLDVSRPVPHPRAGLVVSHRVHQHGRPGRLPGSVADGDGGSGADDGPRGPGTRNGSAGVPPSKRHPPGRPAPHPRRRDAPTSRSRWRRPWNRLPR